MGQISNQVIKGSICALCFSKFVKRHGIPVVCSDCYTKDCGYDLGKYPIKNLQK